MTEPSSDLPDLSTAGALASDGSSSTAAEDDPRHIVDILIEERARGLLHRPRAWKLIQKYLYPALKYPEAIEIADRIGPLPAKAVMEEISTDLSLDLDVKGREHIPPEGPLIVVANHPTGIVDGIAIYDAMKEIRPDLTFFANRDALRVSPRLEEMIIPVEWVVEKRSRARTKETLIASARAFRAGKAVVIFPSGGIAYLSRHFKLIERPWLMTTLSLARKHGTPVLPLNVKSRNSWIYYFFNVVSRELRDMTVFNEMLNKRGKTFRLRFGPVIPPEDLEGDPDATTRALQRYVLSGIPRGRAWEQYRPRN